jgi:hypothetical protein
VGIVGTGGSKSWTFYVLRGLQTKKWIAKSSTGPSQFFLSFRSPYRQEVLISADRVCQKEDWKHRHKLICGKPLTVQNAEVTAVPPPDTPYLNAHQGPAPTENIGLAVGGFKRSPALSFQINNLEASSINNVDYIFINPAGRQR